MVRLWRDRGLRETNPVDAWTIVDGKLYLNWDKDVKAQWSQDIPGYLTKSEANWPAIQAGLQDGTATIHRKEYPPDLWPRHDTHRNRQARRGILRTDQANGRR